MSITYRCNVCDRIDDDCLLVNIYDPKRITDWPTGYHICKECYNKVFGKGEKE